MQPLTRRHFLEQTSAGIGAVSACSALGAPEPAFQGLKFLSVGDMHCTDEASTVYPKQVIDAMNREGGAVTLMCGDLAKDGKREELENCKGVLDQLTMPYYPVVGNHDALHDGDKEEVLFREVMGLKSNNFHFKTGGVHFIAIDHGCGKNMADNTVRPNVMAWLTETVAPIPDEAPIVFFSHYPFAKGIRYRTKNADAVQALFKGKRLLAMISGHFHSNTERIENGILMTTTACSSGRRGNHDGSKAKGFRVFQIDKDLRITTAFKEVPPTV